MSWEAWGTPPDQESPLCPICDNTQHTPDKCEVAASEAHSRTHYEGVIALLLQEQERKLTAAYAEGRTDESKEMAGPLALMRDAFDLLESHLGDSDVEYEDDDEEREYAPVQVAARLLMGAIQAMQGK